MPNATVSAVRFVYGEPGGVPAAVQQFVPTISDVTAFTASRPASTTCDGLAEPARRDMPTVCRGLDTHARTTRAHPRANDARSVKLATAEDVTDLDFPLTSVETAEITIQVLDSSGKAPASGSARLVPIGGALEM